MFFIFPIFQPNFFHNFITKHFSSFSSILFSSVAPNDLLLRLGEFDVSHENEPYPYIERRVQIIAPHPEFDPRTFEYDLALLRFYEPVHYRPNIVPICVPSGNDSYVGKFATVTGWGRLYEGKPGLCNETILHEFFQHFRWTIAGYIATC